MSARTTLPSSRDLPPPLPFLEAQGPDPAHREFVIETVETTTRRIIVRPTAPDPATTLRQNKDEKEHEWDKSGAVGVRRRGRPKTLNTPDHVRAWRDKKTGRVYTQFRHPNHPHVMISAPLWSEAFIERRAEFMAAAAATRTATTIGASLAKPGSLRAALIAYFADPVTFDGLGTSTANQARRILSCLGERNGDQMRATLRGDQLQLLFDQLSPSAQSSTGATTG